MIDQGRPMAYAEVEEVTLHEDIHGVGPQSCILVFREDFLEQPGIRKIQVEYQDGGKEAFFKDANGDVFRLVKCN